jgi:hypothetical protein
MADVMHRDRGGDSAGNDGRRDRGQLILVTGLAIAVMLVALVLLLNTVIYTQNLATRGAEVEDSEAIAFQQEAIEGVGEVIDAENREEYDSRTKIEDNVTSGVARFDRLESRYYAERATIAQVDEETLALTEGILLRQTNASRNFTSEGESVDWLLVEDASAGGGSGMRGVELTVSRENLSDSKSSAFAVSADDGTDEWKARIYDDGGEITIAVENGTEGTASRACSVSGPEATVDLTAGTINGTPCSGLVWANELSGAYDVAFENAASATGTYGLTVDTSAAGTDVQTGNFEGPNAGASPRWAPAVYAAEFEIHFETPSVAFDTTVRTAPGEAE